MGTVWRARDLALHRDVALKEVRPPDPALAEYDVEGARTLRARVLREARALARIDHPGVVTIHHIVDAGEGTYPWLVMELVTGGSLQDRLDRGPMTPAEAAVLGHRLLAALTAAHERDIEHRDVKPANVLLRPDGRPVLTDFGIAAIRESTVLTASGSIIGSPDYMAPERIRGRSSGPAADLWSLGMLLYVAVEGHHPLRRENTLATLAAVLSDDVPPPLRAGGLTDVLTRLLVRDPAARPDTAELDRALAAAATGPEPADAKPAGRDTAGVEAVEEQTGGDGVAGEATVTSFRLAPPSSPSSASSAPSAHPETAPSGPGPGPGPEHGAESGPAAEGTAEPASAALTAGGRRRGRAARFFVSALVVVLAVGIPVGAMAWDWRPGEAGGGPSSAPPSQQSPAAQRPGSSTAPVKTSAPKERDLLTPAGIRAAVAAVHAATDSAKVTGFVVYPDYAVAQSLVKGSTKRYDRYIYRGEDVAVRQGPGGTAFPGSVPTDLDAFDWDALPALLKRADKDLGIDRPTSRYLVVTPGSTLLGSGAGLSVYLSDTYGVAYLNADTKGRVTATHPREN
ncbi:serine/threonine protein kinase [Streptomyces sp. NBC_01255]|uniref:serine/threonine-protein kinase n=1 Tax=Streptomyces sp. NBC_01255 TaxID=2903798 RepID=UPI002E2F6AEB|nr:serine/threonine-protein kinase [Streptomyces sp. NBC_01255]